MPKIIYDFVISTSVGHSCSAYSFEVFILIRNVKITVMIIKLLKIGLLNCLENIRKIRRGKDFTRIYMAFEMEISSNTYSDLEILR